MKDQTGGMDAVQKKDEETAAEAAAAQESCGAAEEGAGGAAPVVIELSAEPEDAGPTPAEQAAAEREAARRAAAEQAAAQSEANRKAASARRAAARRRRGLGLAAGLLAVAVLGGAYFGLSRYNTRKSASQAAAEEAANSASLAVGTLPASGKADQLSYQQNGDTYSFTLSADGVWSYDGDPTFPVDQDKLNTMYSAAAQVYAFSAFTPESDVSEGDYGFDSPAEVITLGDSATGDKTTLYIGSANNVTGQTYLKVSAGSDAYYTTDDTLSGAFSYDLYDLLVYETVPTVTASAVTDVQLQSAGGGVLHFTPWDDAGTEDLSASSTWQVSDGTSSWPADGDTMQTLLDRLATLGYSGCKVWNYTDADAAEYGLDAANRYTLTIQSDETVTDSDGKSSQQPQTLTMYVGRTDAVGDVYYVTLPGQKGLYTLEASKLDGFVGGTAMDYVSLKPFNIAAGYVSGVTLTDTASGTVDNLVLGSAQQSNSDGSSTSTVTTYTLNGSDFDVTAGSTFLSDLAALSGTGAVPAADAGFDFGAAAPVRTVSFALHDCAWPSITFSLYASGSGDYLVRADHGPLSTLTLHLDQPTLTTVLQELSAQS